MHVGRLMRRPAMIMLEEVHRRLADYGFGDVKPAHGAVFSYIGDGAQVTQMAQVALTSKQNMSYLVDYLVKRGYVETFEHLSDGRAKMFRLTAKGKECKAKSFEIIFEIINEWESKLGAKKMKQLEHLLTELNELIEGGIPLK
jgi:DNA-binding MarR family transcriptional regulator